MTVIIIIAVVGLLIYPFVAVLAVVMGFVLISIEPASVLLIIFGGYAASGVFETLKQRRKRRAERREGKSAAPPSEPPTA